MFWKLWKASRDFLSLAIERTNSAFSELSLRGGTVVPLPIVRRLTSKILSSSSSATEDPSSTQSPSSVAQGASPTMMVFAEEKYDEHKMGDDASPESSTDMSETSTEGRLSQDDSYYEKPPVRGRIVDDYELGRTLGKGHFATVKLARRLSTQQVCALKIIEHSASASSRQRELFAREIEALERVQHPNVVRLNRVVPRVALPPMPKGGCGDDYDEEEEKEEAKGEAKNALAGAGASAAAGLLRRRLPRDVLLLDLDLCTGGELFDYVLNGGALPEAAVRHYARQLLSALFACHSVGVFHRDLKPENILVDASPRGTFSLKITDFGLASVVEGPSSSLAGGAAASSTSDSNNNHSHLCATPVGTRSYQAPEVVSARFSHGGGGGGGGGAYDAEKADVWSTGVVLFILLMGNPPFQVADRSDWWFNACRLRRFTDFWAAHLRPPAPATPSAEAMKFLNRFFEVDPAVRGTVAGLASDSWFDGGHPDQDEARAAQFMLRAAQIGEKAKQQEMEAARRQAASASAQRQAQEAVFAQSVVRSVSPPATATSAAAAAASEQSKKAAAAVGGTTEKEGHELPSPPPSALAAEQQKKKKLLRKGPPVLSAAALALLQAAFRGSGGGVGGVGASSSSSSRSSSGFTRAAPTATGPRELLEAVVQSCRAPTSSASSASEGAAPVKAVKVRGVNWSRFNAAVEVNVEAMRKALAAAEAAAAAAAVAAAAEKEKEPAPTAAGAASYEGEEEEFEVEFAPTAAGAAGTLPAAPSALGGGVDGADDDDDDDEEEQRGAVVLVGLQVWSLPRAEDRGVSVLEASVLDDDGNDDDESAGSESAQSSETIAAALTGLWRLHVLPGLAGAGEGLGAAATTAPQEVAPGAPASAASEAAAAAAAASVSLSGPRLPPPLVALTSQEEEPTTAQQQGGGGMGDDAAFAEARLTAAAALGLSVAGASEGEAEAAAATRRPRNESAVREDADDDVF